MPTVLSELNYSHDIVSWIEDPRYSLMSQKIKNTLGQKETIENVIGLPIIWDGTDAILADHAAQNTVNGIVVGLSEGAPAGLTIASAGYSERKYTICYRGMARLNGDKIKTADEEGDAGSLATIEASLKANCNPPIMLVRGPAAAVTSVQNT